MTASNVPYIFTANTTAVSAQVNANFAALVADLNGIDALQITSGTFAIARFPIVTLAKGGTGSDLSATGPGLLQQASNASVVTVAANGQLPATATNDSAAAGKIGEFMTNNNVVSPVSLGSNTASNMTSIVLTAGNWLVFGDVTLNSSNGMTTTKGGISTTSATFGASSNYEIQFPTGTSQFSNFGVPIARVLVATTTTVYLVAMAVFPGGTVLASGTLNAIRPR